MIRRTLTPLLAAMIATAALAGPAWAQTPPCTDPAYCPPSGPAPTVTTGPASGIATDHATLTGTINPNGSQTAFAFVYGTTTSYGSRTATGTLPAGTSPRDVSALITALKPGTTYHYRLVALNGGGFGVGADATFTTKPASTPRPAARKRARLSAKATPRRDRTRPYAYTVSGRVLRPSGVPASACTGKVKVGVKRGSRRLVSRSVSVRRNCTFKTRVRVPGKARLARHGALRITIGFAGNSAMSAAKTKVLKVAYGSTRR